MMKAIVNIARVLVGVLFIFSGLIKANDPLGLSYKMQEFFDLWGMNRFNNWTEWLSIFMIAFEIIAGAALLIGWRKKMIMWFLLLLIIFFTFLTGYAHLSGKFKNCGCFGDCIPITSYQSFIKDIVLFVLIVFLFIQQKWIVPIGKPLVRGIIMLLVVFSSFAIQWYTIHYLPVFDCLPYKKGNNISEQMLMPANAIPDSVVITFIYKKNGKELEFTADKFPADFDSSYTFISRYDKVIRKGSNNEPPIKSFALSGITDIDSTKIVLSDPYAVLLLAENFDRPIDDWKEDFITLNKTAKEKNIPVYIITGQIKKAYLNFNDKEFSDIAILKCDNTAIRTAARTNPCILLLEKGTILGKWSYKRMDNAVSKVQVLVPKLVLPVYENNPDSLLPVPENNKIK